ncbi:hypothetical protein DVH24_018488 [Malus domestica]|uniref:Uncharacterized protein n=1 Tax=Malus domestica TaxID=3750 RepID=A0A498KGF4_MALDO|nr:hypothetical protein DVH24_018488 [Malus domestica]
MESLYLLMFCFFGKDLLVLNTDGISRSLDFLFVGHGATFIYQKKEGRNAEMPFALLNEIFTAFV